jgi:hypothetical protein
MKLITIFLSIAVCFLLVFPAGAKERVGIVDFDSRCGRHFGTQATDIFSTEIVKSNKFIVIERDRLSSVLRELGLQRSGMIDPSTASRAGKIIGLKYIVTGTVSVCDENIKTINVGGIKWKIITYVVGVDVRIIDVETAHIVFADSKTGKKTINCSKFESIEYCKKGGDQYFIEAFREAIQILVKGIDLPSSNRRARGNATPATRPTYEETFVTVKNRLVNIYSRPSFKSKIIGKASSGNRFEIIRRYKGWYKVIIPYGNKSGYIYEKDL